MPRRRGRRRRRRKQKLVVAVPRRKLTSNPIVPMKFRLVSYLYTDATGIVQGTFNVNSLTNAYVPGDTGVPNVPLIDIGNAKALFDMYRVRAVKIEMTPLYSQSQFLTVQHPTPPASGVDFNVLSALPNCCITYDIDNIGQLANYSEMVTRDKKHMFSIFRKTKHYQPVVKAKQATSSQALFGMSGGWNNLQNEAGNLQGIIDIKSDIALTTDGNPSDAFNNSRVMNLIATYYVQFKFRQ